jgi:hypothetical protein
MSKQAPNTILADEKHDSSPPTDDDNVQKSEVVVDDPSENSFFRTFSTNDAEWHKTFEKKLMRKVDMRLIPLMIIMYVYIFVNTLQNFTDESLGTSTTSSIELLWVRPVWAPLKRI